MMVREQRRPGSKAGTVGALGQSIKSSRKTIFSMSFENLDLISQNQRPGLNLVKIENASMIELDNGLNRSKAVKVAADN
jgi:hypothetical protein